MCGFNFLACRFVAEVKAINLCIMSWCLVVTRLCGWVDSLTTLVFLSFAVHAIQLDVLVFSYLSYKVGVSVHNPVGIYSSCQFHSENDFVPGGSILDSFR